MGQHKLRALRTCLQCGAQEVTDAAGMARHADACRPDRAQVVRRRKGLCVECGRKALPWTLCARCRFARSIRYTLNRGAKYGFFVKTADASGRPRYAMGDPTAKVGARGFRNASWTGSTPRGFFPFIEAYLCREARPATEGELVDAFHEYRRDRAARGHLEATAAP